jgi:hypothetical protein
MEDLSLANFSNMVHDPLDRDAFYFIETVSSSSWKLWHLTWPDTLELIVDLTGQISVSSLGNIACIAWNPTSSAYHYGLKINQPDGANHAHDRPVDINLSTGTVSQATESMGGTEAEQIFSYVKDGELYFCWGGTDIPYAFGANSVVASKKAGVNSINWNTYSSVGSISVRGILCPLAPPSTFLILDGDWKTVDFDANSVAAHPTENPGISIPYAVPINHFADGNLRYFFAKPYGISTEKYLVKFNIVTGATSYLLVATEGASYPVGGFGWQSGQTFDLLAYAASDDSGILHCGRLTHADSLSVANMDTILVDENNLVTNRAKILHAFVTKPYAYVAHYYGESGYAITKIKASAFLDPTKSYSQIVG